MGQSKWKYLQNNYINEGKKSKTSFEAFLALVIIVFIQRNEQNRRFKHLIYSNIVLSMLSSLQDPIGSRGKGL